MLSGIQHFAFCKRQWAMIHIEQQWQENLRTVEGNIMHERAHEGPLTESRGEKLISRHLPVCSRTLGINGICDVVEFHRQEKPNETTTSICGKSGCFSVIPVEYKKGVPKENDADRLQLVAQAMCLEEMFCISIREGYLFYGTTRRREKVTISEEYRSDVREICKEMHRLFQRGHTPKVKMTKSCNACSLKEICLPRLENKKTVADYMKTALVEE